MPDPVPTAADMLARQAAYESNARTYPRKLPIAIRKAKGVVVTDADGREYIDCLAGAGTLTLGHNHPRVVEAIRRHLDDELPLHTLDLTTPAKDAFVRGLFGTLPPAFAAKAKIQFCGPTGADAIEAALKLVKTATGRRAVLAFSGGYHGHTHGALALMGNLGPKVAISGLMADAHFLPYPYRFRDPFGTGQADGLHLSGYVEHLLDDPEGGVPPPAAVVLEVVQGEGGAIPAPVEWLRDIRRITQERHIPLVIDEIQTGWGRTGRMYAFEHAGIEPDVLVLSKAIGGGLPMSVVIYRDELDAWQPGAHAGTFRGNQLAMSAGLATLHAVHELDLVGHAERLGDRLQEKLRATLGRHSFVGEVRGRGLMIGVEIVDPGVRDRWGRPAADGATARRLQQECFRRGLIIELGGRHGCVMRFLPPLILTAEQADTIVGIVAEACAAVAAGSPAPARVG